MTKDEARQKCKTDRMYLAKVLGYDFQDDVHPDMFAALAKGDKHSRLILWPRGHYKTSAVVVDIIGNILNRPDARILVMQATLTLTKGWVKEIASHFDGKNPASKLLTLFPDFAIESGNATGFTVQARQRKHLKEPTVAAASPRAVSTGQHYTDGYFDDLVNKENFRSIVAQDKIEVDFSHYRPLIDPGGYVTVTGTRYTFFDLYQRIIKSNKGEWEISIRKCYKPDGSLLFPRRFIGKDAFGEDRFGGFTLEGLAFLKEENPETFSAQWLNEILSASSQKFPESLILGAVKSTTDKEYPTAASNYFFIDLAEGGSESDDAVITIGRQDRSGRIWLLDCIGHNWSVLQLVTVILQQAVLHRPARVYIEKQPGTVFFTELLTAMGNERNIRLPLEIVPGGRQKGAKNIRIESLEILLKRKQLFFCAGIRDFDKLVEEFTQFPRGRHDDRPDCIALLANKLSQQHFPQTPKFAPQVSWVVNAVLADDSTANPSPSGRSLCGDDFS